MKKSEDNDFILSWKDGRRGELFTNELSIVSRVLEDQSITVFNFIRVSTPTRICCVDDNRFTRLELAARTIVWAVFSPLFRWGGEGRVALLDINRASIAINSLRRANIIRVALEFFTASALKSRNFNSSPINCLDSFNLSNHFFLKISFSFDEFDL